MDHPFNLASLLKILSIRLWALSGHWNSSPDRGISQCTSSSSILCAPRLLWRTWSEWWVGIVAFQTQFGQKLLATLQIQLHYANTSHWMNSVLEYFLDWTPVYVGRWAMTTSPILSLTSDPVIWSEFADCFKMWYPQEFFAPTYDW